ncbi:MAG TPA: CDP-diacylglycerol--glycerol-3-phosphate 3-phosphatidyltransferase [Woeseiaceae bacterium]|nr:CDP-diacylglycerol--glycerol-3-phosphate 3-phosphatidyltransferase [Woeseiaceae bacterium]
MKLNLAIILTLIRILAIPLAVLCFYAPIPHARPIAGLVFGIAAVTDLLDGWVARRFNQSSRFGEFLDPVADKLMVAIAMILLVQSDPRSTVDFIAMIIIGREIAVSALREWMATIGERANVRVSWGGKVKTVLQMFGIAFMLYQKPVLGIEIYNLGFVLLLLAAGMTLWSMFAYLRAAWPSMHPDR